MNFFDGKLVNFYSNLYKTEFLQYKGGLDGKEANDLYSSLFSPKPESCHSCNKCQEQFNQAYYYLQKLLKKIFQCCWKNKGNKRPGAGLQKLFYGASLSNSTII